MNMTETAFQFIDDATVNNVRKNVVGTIFIGAGITIFSIGLVIVMTKTE